ncbi:MAG: acylphosphatase [Candidatus Omnitrophota bacterium]|nr:acylphosphatase [Candidatus Omnitrophota bacterium]
MTNKRAHVFYSGNVQGVGFRYTAEDIAESLGLKGWVKNLSDGRVEVVAEGDEKDLKEFLDKISNGQMARYIKDTEVSWEKATKEFDSFEVAF